MLTLDSKHVSDHARVKHGIGVLHAVCWLRRSSALDALCFCAQCRALLPRSMSALRSRALCLRCMQICPVQIGHSRARCLPHGCMHICPVQIGMHDAQSSTYAMRRAVHAGFAELYMRDVRAGCTCAMRKAVHARCAVCSASSVDVLTQFVCMSVNAG